MMIKYGVEQKEILEFVMRKIRLKEMTYEDGVKKLRQHGINMTVDDLMGEM